MAKELAERVGGGRKPGGHAHPLGQLGNHLAEAGVLAADRLDVRHSELRKGNDVLAALHEIDAFVAEPRAV